MRNQKAIILVVGVLFAAQMGCQKKPNVSNDLGKVSYAVGQGVAQNLAKQGIQLDADVVGYAVTQTLKGEKAPVSEEEMKKAVAGLQQAVQQNLTQEAEKNKGIAAEFLTANKGKEGVKTTSSGLQYKVVKQGTGKKPGPQDKVTVHYVGTLVNGQKFDSSRDRGQPSQFDLPQIIKGWQEALQLMPEGSVFQLYIPPELGYGMEAKPGIPPNSVLVFEVELIKVGKGG